MTDIGFEAARERYRLEHPELFAQHPDFASWFETEYRPLAGAWQY
jgi:hypothetical protein